MHFKSSVRASKLCSAIAVKFHILRFRFSRKFWSTMVLSHAFDFYPHVFGISWFWQSMNLKPCNFGQNKVHFFFNLVCTYTTIKNQTLICCSCLGWVFPFLKKVQLFVFKIINLFFFNKLFLFPRYFMTCSNSLIFKDSFLLTCFSEDWFSNFRVLFFP